MKNLGALIRKEIVMDTNHFKTVGLFFARMGKLLAILAAFGCVAVLARGWRVPNNGVIVWDPAAGKALEHELIKLHEALNAMDLATIKQEVIGDDVLVTFDVDPDTLQPIKLKSQDDIIAYTERFFESLKKTGITSKAEHPMIACRATSYFGACTEECRVKLTLPDGSSQAQQLRATVLAVKQGNDWKFIQWHMSEAGPSYPLQP
jgi:ketosteroid isomerase-like protein